MTVYPSDQHFSYIKQFWNLDSDELGFIRYVENYVYEGALKKRPVIIRLTDPSHRSKNQLEAELDWMHFLYQKGVILARPIQSTNHSFVEESPCESAFLISVFEKAPGKALSTGEDFNPIIMYEWGRYVGRLHDLTRHYEPPSRSLMRPQWDESSSFKIVLKGLERKDTVAYNRFIELYEWIKICPKDASCFGLVHADLHFGNFFVNNNQITAFDFDDCCYHWFLYDLVTPLFQMWRKRDNGELIFPYGKLEEQYIKGYLEEYSLDRTWLNKMEPFCQFRISTVYHWAKCVLKEGRFDKNEQARKWCNDVFAWSNIEFIKKLSL